MGVSPEAKRYAAKVVRRLNRAYPDAECALQFDSPLELLIATILSAQCTDSRVNLVTRDLFRKYRSASDYAKARSSRLEKDIQSTGFYRNKAKAIRAVCRTLAEEHEGRVPEDMDVLVELPGIGRKTANVVLGTAYGIASGVVVDTHVLRISRRLGLTSEKAPEKIESDLMALIPKREWIDFGHRMIHHGRNVCSARKPKCDQCPMESICPRIGVNSE
jgi:endonuclease-3